MFISAAKKLPRDLVVAVSGGPDSMVALDYLKNKHNVMALYVHYGSKEDSTAYSIISNYSRDNKIPLRVHYLNPNLEPTSNLEKYWREERYEIFSSVYAEFSRPIVLGHNLNDCAETYLMSTLSGTPKIMDYSGPSGTIRPFILTPKKDILEYAMSRGIIYHEDPHNTSYRFLRSKVRNSVMPNVLDAYPGYLKVVKRLVSNKMNRAVR